MRTKRRNDGAAGRRAWCLQSAAVHGRTPPSSRNTVGSYPDLSPFHLVFRFRFRGHIDRHRDETRRVDVGTKHGTRDTGNGTRRRHTVPMSLPPHIPPRNPSVLSPLFVALTSRFPWLLCSGVSMMRVWLGFVLMPKKMFRAYRPPLRAPLSCQLLSCGSRREKFSMLTRTILLSKYLPPPAPLLFLLVISRCGVCTKLGRRSWSAGGRRRSCRLAIGGKLLGSTSKR